MNVIARSVNDAAIQSFFIFGRQMGRAGLLRRLCLLAMTLLTACAPQQQPYHPASDPGVGIGPDTVLAADGMMLPLRHWLPLGKPKAIVVALHGFNDYSNAFQTTGEFFSKQGVALVAYDQRGFGHAHYTGIWGNEKNLTADLAQCVREVKRRYPHVPVYVLGESMGGAAVIAALADPFFPSVQGAILSAPAVWGKDTMNPLFRTTLWAAAHTIPEYHLTGSNLKIMASNNIPMLMRLAYDPLVIKATRVDTIYGLVKLMDSAYAKVPDVKMPVLLLYGGHDEVIPREPVENALKRFSVPIRFAYYPDGYHMLLRDIQGEIVMRDIVSWIEKPEKPLPSGFGHDWSNPPTAAPSGHETPAPAMAVPAANPAS